MKKIEQAQVGIGAALILIGVTVMVAWILRNVAIVRIFPNSVSMVFNTALCFTLIGIAFLLPFLKAPWARTGQTAIGWYVIAIASATLIENVVDKSLGIDLASLHSWLGDHKSAPGRMATNACIGFICCGLGLIFMQRVRRKVHGIVIQIATFSVLAVGLTGFVGYALGLEMLYTWFHPARMALHTAIAMIMVGMGLWLSWYPADWYNSRRFFQEDEKVSFIGVAMLIVVALTVGIAGLAAQESILEKTISENLTTILKRQVVLLRNVVAHSLGNSEAIAARSGLVRTMRALHDNPGNQEALGQLQEVGKSILLVPDVSAIAIYDANDRKIMEVGEFAEKPQLISRLQSIAPVTMFWNDGLYVKTRTKIVYQNQTIGFMVVEQALSLLMNQLSNKEGGGQTVIINMCMPASDQFLCFPEFHNSKAFLIPRNNPEGTPVPMNYAVKGLSGIYKGLDYRGRSVIAAYGPIDTSGLGIIVKQETGELYRPLRKQLELSLPLLVLFVFASAWLLNFHVKPLATKLLLSERDAHEKELRTRAVVDNVGEGIITFNEQGEIESFNNAASRIFGYTQTEAVGESIRFLMPDELRDKHEAGMWHYLQGGEAKVVGKKSIELPGLHKSGTVFPLELTVNEMHIGGQRLFVGIVRDISERKKVERMKNEFISTVSHELRTPLTSIRGSLGLLTGGAVGDFSAQAKQLLDIANANCERLGRMINDILDIEKIESGNMHFEFVTQSLLPLVKDAIHATEGYAAQFNVRLDLRADDPDIHVTVDRDRMTQVVVNLLSNAIKFSPSGEVVEVRIARVSDQVRLSVTDYGRGIPEEFRERIFQKFSQVDSSDARQKEGSGLGLNICKSIVKEHRGQIDFRSEVGRGSEFFVDLPIAEMA